MDTTASVSEVLNKLKEEGYTVKFNHDANCLLCHGNSLQLHPDAFAVDRHFRFEGNPDTGDDAVIYAISSTKHHVKGTLLNGYGGSGDEPTGDLARALQEKAQAATNMEPSQAAVQRPVGDSTLKELDLSLLRLQLKQGQTWNNSDRNAMTVYKESGMRLVLLALRQGAVLKTHTAPGTLSVQVLEGKIEFSTAQHTARLGEGHMLVLHAGIPHSVLATEESVFLLTIATAPVGN